MSLINSITDFIGLTSPEARRTRFEQQQKDSLLESLYARYREVNEQLTRNVQESWASLTRTADPFDHWNIDSEWREWMPIGSSNDRRRGDDRPYLFTIQDLRQYRGISRWLCTQNSVAITLLDHLTNFVIGDGYKWEVFQRGQKETVGYTPTKQRNPVIDRAQDYLDEFCDVNDWSCGIEDREREAYKRLERDGEVVLRFFQGDQSTNGIPLLRWVEPDSIDVPPEYGYESEFSWGIKTPHDDIEKREAFYLRYWSAYEQDWVGQIVPESELLYAKINTDRTVKRGIPSFVPVASQIRTCNDLLKNMSVSAAIQAAIVYVREHAPGVTSEQITKMISGNEEYRAPVQRGPTTTGDRYESVNFAFPGQVVDVTAGMKFTASPASAGMSAFVQVLQACLRGAGARFGMPEYFTGDASNANFASTLVSGGPFERAAKARQKVFKSYQRALASRALRYGALSGRIPKETLSMLDVRIICPGVSIANQMEEEQIRQMRLQNKIISVQTAQQEAGYEPEIENANIAESAKQEQAMQPEMPGIDDQQPGQEQQPPEQQPTEPELSPEENQQADEFINEIFGDFADSLSGDVMEGFSGIVTDKLGRKIKYQSGKRVKFDGNDQPEQIKNNKLSQAPQPVDTPEQLDQVFPELADTPISFKERLLDVAAIVAAKHVSKFYALSDAAQNKIMVLADNLLDTAEDAQNPYYTSSMVGNTSNPFMEQFGVQAPMAMKIIATFGSLIGTQTGRKKMIKAAKSGMSLVLQKLHSLHGVDMTESFNSQYIEESINALRLLNGVE